MLTSLALIFLIGLLLGEMFKKLHLPALMGMLITGILLGPYAFDLIDSMILEASTELRRIALIIILARAGLSLDLGDLKKVGRSAVMMCFVPACFEIGAMMLLAPKLLGISLLDAAIMGSVIAAVSPAVVVPRMIKLIESGYGTAKSIPQLIMAGAAVDDVFVIVLFTSFTSLAMGEAISPLQLIKIPVSIILGILIGAGCGFLLSRLFEWIKMRTTVKVLILLSACFLLMTLEEVLESTVPFSGLIAVMATGVLMLKSHETEAKRISAKLSKLWVAAEILLFVLVGATVDIGYAVSAGRKIIVLILAVMIVRMAGVFVCTIKTQLNVKERLFCMIAYIPKATVQAAIGGLPLAMGLACGQIVLTGAVIAILVTAPLGALGIDLLYKKLIVPHKTHFISS